MPVAASMLRRLLIGAGALAAGTAAADEVAVSVAALDDECATGDEACALSALQLRARKAAVAANWSDGWGMGMSCRTFGCFSYSWAQPCQCNPYCVEWGNCCSDYVQTCQGQQSNQPAGQSGNQPGGQSSYQPGGNSNYQPGGDSNYKPGGHSTYHPGGVAGGCYQSDRVYSLNWEAKGATFFDKFTFVTQDDVHGAHQFTTKDEAVKQGVISTKNGQAQLRYGGLRMPSYAGEAYKRYSVNIHTSEAWNPSPGFVAVLHYTHLPHGCGIWPSFWAMNSDALWPKGGELDIMEFANGERNKVTFHIASKCFLNKEKAKQCAPRGHTRLHQEECQTDYFNGKLGCMPYQRQPTGAELAAQPGIMAAEWTDDHITIFHIPEAEIPHDLRNDQPRPETWTRWVLAYIPFEKGCMSHIGPQELVLNLQLCGDWAGATWGKTCSASTNLWKGHGCVTGLSQTTDCCTKYVTSPLREVQYKYQSDWDIKSLKVYTANGERSKQSGTFLRNGVPLTA